MLDLVARRAFFDHCAEHIERLPTLFGATGFVSPGRVAYIQLSVVEENSRSAISAAGKNIR